MDERRDVKMLSRQLKRHKKLPVDYLLAVLCYINTLATLDILCVIPADSILTWNIRLAYLKPPITIYIYISQYNYVVVVKLLLFHLST